ncbi:hypothetical protein FUA23_07260 [Neolewinella aurantiaca]|uniref:Deoxyribose-phosphate aldolase n=1 Tax=Neolewinella aurantiaca TaxID=2602767 RepID=A0A5C7FKA7_9BACT|nr:DUF6503 family protein [Neolewinella aurantiaca]TXF90311.1 hypothetical protein FUA23_07260 [Neolewinella aurantiaca]
MNQFPAILLLLAFAFSCQSPAPEQGAQAEVTTSSTADAAPSPADITLAKAVEAHGGGRYDTASYSFVFRNKAYTFTNDGTDYRYSVTNEVNGVTIVDVLENGKLTHTLDGVPIDIIEKDVAKFSEALNSVIYFATLPHKLQDPAVLLTQLDSVSINDATYHTLKVQFKQEGGGTDHDDNFRYWINTATNRIDYLAYDYLTNGGGVRFRSAYNPRVVEGILFQDYINYKAPVGTSLDDLPALFEQGKLEELSRIETEEVKSLK